MILVLQDFLIGNHGPNDEKYQELFDNAVYCFTGAHRAKPLSHSDYVSFLSLYYLVTTSY